MLEFSVTLVCILEYVIAHRQLQAAAEASYGGRSFGSWLIPTVPDSVGCTGHPNGSKLSWLHDSTHRVWGL